MSDVWKEALDLNSKFHEMYRSMNLVLKDWFLEEQKPSHHVKHRSPTENICILPAKPHVSRF